MQGLTLLSRLGACGRTTAISLVVLAILALSLWSPTASRVVIVLVVLLALILSIYQIISAARNGHEVSFQAIPDALRKFFEDEDDTRIPLPFFPKKDHVAHKPDSGRR